MKKNRSKQDQKAQMEIMGLAVIVVLITLGIFFMISFKSGDNDSDLLTYQGLSRRQMATKFLATYRQTNIECGIKKDINFDDLIYKCRFGEELDCDGSGMPVCDYLEQETSEIIDAFFERQNLPYLFEMDKLGIQIRNTDDCTSLSTGERASIKISLYKQGVHAAENVSLKICS